MKNIVEQTAPPALVPSAGITTERLAAAIGYHEESVRRAIRQGRIQAIPFGRTWRIPPAEVTRILANGLPCGGAN